VATALQAKLGTDYEVLTWDERDPNAKMFIGRLRGIIVIVTAVLFVLMLSFIVNAMLSAVYERVREIGTMLAVGVRRRQILVMFLVEAMTLGLGASLVGSVIGSAVVFYFSKAGIVLTPPGSKPAAMYPFVSLETLVIAIGVSVVGAVIAALYPAFKASRLRPVEALRAN
jgi:putative ABC transport system permease protein